MDEPTSKELQDLLYTLMDQSTQILVENTQIKKTLEEIAKVNKNLLEENIKLKAKLDEINRNLENDSTKRKEEHRKLFSHFTAEIRQLKTCHENAGKSTTNGIFTIPILSSVQEVMDFDSKIEYDEDIKNNLIKQFKAQPIDDVKKFICDNLKLVFRFDLISSQFSWVSANRNISAKDMNYVQLLKDVTQQEIPLATEAIIDKHIKTFFNLVKDRINKRNKRKRDPLD